MLGNCLKDALAGIRDSITVPKFCNLTESYYRAAWVQQSARYTWLAARGRNRSERSMVECSCCLRRGLRCRRHSEGAKDASPSKLHFISEGFGETMLSLTTVALWTTPKERRRRSIRFSLGQLPGNAVSLFVGIALTIFRTRIDLVCLLQPGRDSLALSNRRNVLGAWGSYDAVTSTELRWVVRRRRQGERGVSKPQTPFRLQSAWCVVGRRCCCRTSNVGSARRAHSNHGAWVLDKSQPAVYNRRGWERVNETLISWGPVRLSRFLNTPSSTAHLREGPPDANGVGCARGERRRKNSLKSGRFEFVKVRSPWIIRRTN